MIYTTYYDSPVGKILLASKDEKLIGVWIEGQNYYFNDVNEETLEKENEILLKTKEWLDDYFSGKNPDINKIDLNPIGTSFRKEVWNILCEIPYGKTVTYGEIADRIAKRRNIKRMSAQAVGGAVGHNPISIIIPCHRVVGSDGNLTGFDGGIDKKVKLLEIENVDMKNFYIPK